MPEGPEGFSPAPQEPQQPKPEGFFARLFKRHYEGSGVVGLDPGAQAELEAARNSQAAEAGVESVPVPEASTPTRAQELRASADARGWAGHKDVQRHGEMPATPQAVEAPASAPESADTTQAEADELREAA